MRADYSQVVLESVLLGGVVARLNPDLPAEPRATPCAD